LPVASSRKLFAGTVVLAAAIRTIHEDRDGTLWLGTNTGGLNRFDADKTFLKIGSFRCRGDSLPGSTDRDW
jgi:ligand-binding sensor domain-containing protein